MVIFLFKMALKHSAEELPSVLKCRKAVMCLMKKIQVLDKLPSAASYSAVDQEFNANESTIWHI